MEGGRSNFLTVNKQVREGCVHALLLFNTCMDCILGGVVEESHYGTSIDNNEITYIIYADYAVIFPEKVRL